VQELAQTQNEQTHGQQPIDLSSAMVSFCDMLTLDLPERERYLPWLPERGLAMVYGPRGVGKTQFMLGLATHLVNGQTYLGWEIPKGVGVLYIDGEMPLEELRQRAVLLSAQESPTALYFLTGELVFTKLERDLVLTQEAMRQAIGTLLDAHPEIRIIILDNISCLFSGISEDSKEDWEPMNAWLIRLRHRGLSVILVHHAGKTGQQRGTSGREDVLDTVIALSWPPQYETHEGCHFHFHFTKTRSTRGAAVEALDVRLESLGQNRLTWTVTTLQASRTQQIRRLLNEGDLSVGEIAKECDVSLSYVYRVKREAELP
jgi:hypothetical protein